MKTNRYLQNCFLLLIPVLLWNVLLVDYLPAAYSPEVFEKGIPKAVTFPENILRIVVFVCPAIMVLSLTSKLARIGLAIYLFGVSTYFLSWLAVICCPDSLWSKSAVGFTAPAYTTVFWFIGIGLIGKKSFLNFKSLTTTYIVLSLIFVILHTMHVYIVYRRLSGQDLSF